MTDYERMIDRFRSQLDDVWSKRRVDQLRDQLDDLRRSTDELLKSYNRVMSTGSDLLGETQRRLAKFTRDSGEAAADATADGGFSWWVPVAILGAIGAAYWLYNTMTSGTSDAQRPHFTNYQAGSPPPMSTTEPPYQEPR